MLVLYTFIYKIFFFICLESKKIKQTIKTKKIYIYFVVERERNQCMMLRKEEEEVEKNERETISDDTQNTPICDTH